MCGTAPLREFCRGNLIFHDRFAPHPTTAFFGAAQSQLACRGNVDEFAKGATVTMSVNGSEVAEGELPKTIPVQISMGERLDIGEDIGPPVAFTASRHSH